MMLYLYKKLNYIDCPEVLQLVKLTASFRSFRKFLIFHTDLIIFLVIGLIAFADVLIYLAID